MRKEIKMSDDMRFDGKVAVVTGAGGGVGRAYALDLARRGAKIVVNDLGGATDGTGSSDAAASQVAKEIEALGSEAVANFDSVATLEGGKKIIDAALDAFGRCDVLIANAGILRDQSFPKLTPENLKAVLDVHLMGSFSTAQPAFTHMKESGNGGKIILTTSASGLFGNFGQANYTAAKMGIWGLMRTLSIEGVRSNIQVNCVAPAARTRLTGGEADTGADAPRSVAPLVVALCHESATITGETFMSGYNWYTRCFMAQAPGWAAPEDAEVSAEEIVAHWDEIRATEGFNEIAHALVAMEPLAKLRGGK
jgi:NAD(P)-dependent dehydrogenase (short-subunit alcohol dehydrogenase family)